MKKHNIDFKLTRGQAACSLNQRSIAKEGFFYELQN